tara:strand:+ start:4238 stop:4471 length:234 start_codon:yes stop_codon:yes gene_type:complete
MSKKSKKLDEAYTNKKNVKVKEIFADPDWSLNKVNYDESSGKYEIDATHKDGRNIIVKRNKQYVDNLIKEMINEKED